MRRELAGLGIESRIGESGRVYFRGDIAAICTTNLWLRTADRVLIRVAEFDAPDFDALFETVREICWGELIPVDGCFPVTGRSVKSQLSSVPAVQRSVKRAIVDAMCRDHATQTLEEDGADYKVDIALLKDVATVTLDTTGRSLHRRGYRTLISGAPLKETLASAMVLLSFWDSDKPLLDPFCGSGTIPIEAARIGRNLAPGLSREFSFTRWSDSIDAAFADLRSTAEAASLPVLGERIVASDVDDRILHAARENAIAAGVADDIHFQAKRFSEISSKRRFGCLITNPPYGKRLGDDWQVDELYRSMPDVLRGFPTWSHYFLTAYPGFESAVGRKADRRRKLYNGRIECTYYQFHGPKPVTGKGKSDTEQGEFEHNNLAPVKPYVHASGEAAFGELSQKANEQAELFKSRLSKRARHLRRWPSKRGITCFRLYERDVPEIPLVVDRYEDHLHITEYERPHDRDPAQHANWLELMARTAGETLEIAARNVHLKRRQRVRQHGQYEKIEQTGHRVEVHEGGLKFLVNLVDYVDTGLFLDHRVTRSMVRDVAAGKTFLNLFAYTGSFSVYAAAGGARKTVSVDLSSNYLSWARDNMRLNGLDGDQHQYVSHDVGQFIDQHAPGEMYDLVVLDPPTYSRSKRTEKDWNVQTDAPELLERLLPLVRKGGVIFFSTNFRRFKFETASLPVSEVHEISKQTVPEDFRNRRIHRCWRIVR